jgi:O-methyltransferase
MVKGVNGDIVECGIGRGRSLITIMVLESLSRTFPDYMPRKIFGLDSFEGFPEPSKEDASPRNPKKGEWSASPNGEFTYSIENLIKIIHNAEIDPSVISDLTLLKGFFDRTALEATAKKIAILHLDGDLYHSVFDPLFILEEKIAPGGVVVLDDFKLYNPDRKNEAFPGARRAVEEFMNDRNDFAVRESIRGTPYLLKAAD